MGFCKECGQAISNPDQEYCTECGAPIRPATAQRSKAASNGSENVQKEKKAVSKKQKRNRIIGAAAAVLLAILYFAGDYLTSPERLVKGFTDAVKASDEEKMAGYLSFHGDDKKITGEDLKVLTSYLKENPDVQRSMLLELDKQSKNVDSANAFISVSDTMVNLDEGKGFLFYDTYELVVEPIFITISTNVEGADILVNGKKAATSDSDDFSFKHGPMVPGNHAFSAEMKTDYADLETEHEATILNPDDYVDLYMDVTYVDFYFEEMGDVPSRLLVNDQPVEYDFLKEGSFGPIIAEETKVAGEVEFPWGTMKTEEKYPYDSFDVTFHLDDDSVKEIGTVVKDFSLDYMEAWQAGDASKIGKVSTDFRSDFEYLLDWYYDEGYAYERQITGMKMDTSEVEIYYTDGKYYMDVFVQEDYTYAEYSDPDDKYKEEDTDIYLLTLVYDESWNVYHKEDYWGYELQNPADLGIETEVYKKGKTTASDSGGAESDETESITEESDATNTASAVDETDIEQVASDYVYALVTAINTGDYDLVSPYILEGSALEGMQQDLVDYLYGIDHSQEVIDVEVTDLTDNGTYWYVYTDETIKSIYQSGEEETKEYSWKYTIEFDGGEPYLSNIE